MKNLELRRYKIEAAAKETIRQAQLLKNDIECWNRHHPDDPISSEGETRVIDHMSRITFSKPKREIPA